MLDIIRQAEWPVWPLLLLSILGLALILERAVALRRSRVLPDGVLEDVLHSLRHGPVPADRVSALATQSPLGRLAATAIQARHLPRAQLDEALEQTGRELAADLNRYLNGLGTIASLAPLLGLFGTVIGMISLFGAWTPEGADPSQLARGIAIALYNTAIGIGIAVPALAAQRGYRARAQRLTLALERAALTLAQHAQSRNGNA